MAKKVSNLERVVDFFVNGEPAEVQSAFATVSAIMRAKNAPAAKGSSKVGRPRKNRETQPNLPENGQQ